MNQITLQPAYLLHYRPYRDTSLLLEFFTQDFGRISAVARGARGARSTLRGLLQPFVPLLVSFAGKSELLSLRQAEPNGISRHFTGEALLSGFYLNELLMRLLQRSDAFPNVFCLYDITLTLLQDKIARQPALRVFEKRLLIDLGYALQLENDATSQEIILPSVYYYFDVSHGFTRCVEQLHTGQGNIFLGQSLLDLHEEKFDDAISLRDAKRIMRLAFAPLLGHKPLKTRELF